MLTYVEVRDSLTGTGYTDKIIRDIQDTSSLSPNYLLTNLLLLRVGRKRIDVIDVIDVFDGAKSSPVKLVCGVPQGSVAYCMGSLTFVLYNADVMTIALHEVFKMVYEFTHDIQLSVAIVESCFIKQRYK